MNPGRELNIDRDLPSATIKSGKQSPDTLPLNNPPQRDRLLPRPSHRHHQRSCLCCSLRTGRTSSPISRTNLRIVFAKLRSSLGISFISKTTPRSITSYALAATLVCRGTESCTSLTSFGVFNRVDHLDPTTPMPLRAHHFLRECVPSAQ
jgi:hypothetical protein